MSVDPSSGAFPLYPDEVSPRLAPYVRENQLLFPHVLVDVWIVALDQALRGVTGAAFATVVAFCQRHAEPEEPARAIIATFALGGMHAVEVFMTDPSRNYREASAVG